MNIRHLGSKGIWAISIVGGLLMGSSLVLMVSVLAEKPVEIVKAKPILMSPVLPVSRGSKVRSKRNPRNGEKEQRLAKTMLKKKFIKSGSKVIATKSITNSSKLKVKVAVVKRAKKVAIRVAHVDFNESDLAQYPRPEPSPELQKLSLERMHRSHQNDTAIMDSVEN